MENAISQLAFRKNLEFDKREQTNGPVATTASTAADNHSPQHSMEANGHKNDSSRNSKTCNICLCSIEANDGEVILPCGHGKDYHRNCLADWLRCHSNCPECRQKVYLSDVQVASKDTIEIIKWNHENEMTIK